MLAAGLCLALAGGCLTQENVYDDIRRSRLASYRSWVAAHEGRQSAQLVLDGELSLDAAALLAMGNNKQLQAVLQEEEVARGRITEAYAEALPKVDISADYVRLDKVAGFTIEGQKVTFGSVDNYAMAATLSQPIFRGGAISAGVRAARLYRHFADEQVSAVKQQVLYSVRLNYCNALLASELVKVGEGDLDMARRHLERIRKRRKEKMELEFDELRAKVEVTNYEAQLIRRKNGHHMALTSLFKAMGVSQESNVKLSDSLKHEPVSPKLGEAVEQAFVYRPELLLAELELRLQREAVKVAKSGWWPQADVHVAQRFTRPDPHSSTEIHWGGAWDAGVSLTYPLFDGFRTSSRVRQEKAKLKRKDIELHNTEEQVLLDIKQALFGLEDAEELIKSQAENLNRARKALELIKRRYDEGMKIEIDVLDAHQAISRTRALYFQAVHSHMIANLALQRATGELKAPAEDDGGTKATGGQ